MDPLDVFRVRAKVGRMVDFVLKELIVELSVGCASWYIVTTLTIPVTLFPMKFGG